MISYGEREIANRSLLLSSMPDDVRSSIVAASSSVELTRGESLFAQGCPADYVFVVLSGWVKLYRTTRTGHEAVVETFTRGESFGEAVAFRREAYPVDAECVTDCRLLRIGARHMLKALHANPEVAIAMLASTLHHLRSLVSQVEQLKAQTGAQRVAAFLLELSDVTDGATTVTLPYEKTLIAGRLGLKPESLSRAFAKLKEFGVTVDHHHASVDSVERLRAFSEQDPAMAWSKGQ
ncbi:MAG: Crp/Fnr family transcriptional regulator [Pseudomonadota bacterium]